MSKSTTSLMATLMEEADQAGKVKEHVLEQAHYASQDVENKMGQKFENLVSEINSEWGTPEQNIIVEQEDGRRTPLPKWLHEAANQAGSNKLLRVAFWKRGAGYSFIMLNIELDSKDRPKYYNLVIGSRRRQSEGVKIGKLREERPWWTILCPWLRK